MGKAKCLSFKQRIYEEKNGEENSYHRRHNSKRGEIFRRILRSMCPKSGRDDELAPLDSVTPARFDNGYFYNVIQGQGLLQSDDALVTEDLQGEIRKHVWAFANDQRHFFASFAKSMVKMASINVLTGEQGQIRNNCRLLNT